MAKSRKPKESLVSALHKSHVEPRSGDAQNLGQWECETGGLSGKQIM